MSIEVRIPTILRTYTGGEKAVAGEGGTLADVLVDLDGRHPGLRERIVDEKGLRRFVNVYVNDEDVRFMGGLATVIEGRRHGDGPACRRRGLTAVRCVTTPLSTPSGARRSSDFRGCRRPLMCGCGPSSKTATRPARSRTAPLST